MMTPYSSARSHIRLFPGSRSKLPLLVQKIEEHLYSFAESKDGFTCHDTLKERLNNLALQTGMSKAESQVLANLLAGEAITFRDVPATLSSGYGRTAAPKPSSRTTVDLTGLFADSPRENTKDTSSPQKFGNKDQRPHQHDDCRHDPLLPKSPKVANKIQPHTGAEEAKAALKGSTMSISTDSKLQMSPSAVQQDLTKVSRFCRIFHNFHGPISLVRGLLSANKMNRSRLHSVKRRASTST